MSKKINNTNIETSTNETEKFAENENTIRFIRKSVLGEHTISAVVFNPINANGKFVYAKPWDNKAFFNAIREFVGEITLPAGEFIHVHNADRSKYDGTRMIYVGGNLIRQAIFEGQKEITVTVDQKNIVVKLPANSDGIGEWARVTMRTDFSGNVYPASSEQHRVAIDMKHYFLEKMMHGTRVIIYSEPSMIAGKVYDNAEKNAHKLEEDLLNEDGHIKPADEVAQNQYEHMSAYRSQAIVASQTRRIEKIAPVVGVKILDSIVVDGEEKGVNLVLSGWYRVLDANGQVKYVTYRHVLNGTGANLLRTMATQGLQLQTINGL